MIPKVLFDICNCSNFDDVLSGKNVRTPCTQVVVFQKDQGENNIANYHIPEPWSGDIVKAPILFISSNPGYAKGEFYPSHSWPDPIKADYFINRFKDRGNGYSWVYKNKLLNKNGTQGKSVRYWSSIKKRAEELLEREAIPGTDYCNTELVHCKSQDQIGVVDALHECTNKFVKEIIAVSGAKIIIGIGSFVKDFFNGLPKVGGIPIFYLPHPNAFQPKTFANKYSDAEIQVIKNLIKSEVPQSKKVVTSDIELPTETEVIKFMNSQFSIHR